MGCDLSIELRCYVGHRGFVVTRKAGAALPRPSWRWPVVLADTFVNLMHQSETIWALDFDFDGLKHKIS